MLSKSQYILAKQCHRAIWLRKNRPNIFENIESETMEKGIVVGEYARELFPNGTLVEYDGDIENAIKITEKLIETGGNTIYEPALKYKEYLAICDILHKTSEGWEMYEVKSATELKPEYIDDAVFQYFVLSNLKIDVTKVNIIYINNQYERNGELDLTELFTIEDITEKVKTLSDNISEELELIMSVIGEKEEPKLDININCFHPYECVCKEYCWSHIPENSVFDLSLMRNTMQKSIV